MTDQDRGAYMPHAEAPLAFDARRPSDRRPLPMTLIASAGVLALIVGALAMAYRGGVRGSEEPRPVGEPIAAIKTAAAPEAASDTAPEKLDVYAAQNVPSQPNFAPPPEAPKARPVAAAPAPTAPTGLQVHTVDPVKVRIGEPEVVARVAPEPAAAAPVVAAAPAPKPLTPAVSEKLAAASSRTAITPGAADRPAPKPVVVAKASSTAIEAAPVAKAATKSVTHTVAAADTAPAAAKAAPAKVAKAEPAAKEAAAASTTKGGAAVQVGAFSSAELAQKGFADAGKLASLGGHAKSVEKVARDGKTFYRATLSGFSDKAAAKAFCASLAAKGGRCLVKS